jgi:DNA-binding NarL/FixJ family response regulator
LPPRPPEGGSAASTPPRIRVFLVDDHSVVLEALASTLGRQHDMVVVGTAGSVREVADLVQVAPDVAIVDYHLPDGTGADACRQIKARWPGARIVMLSASGGQEMVLGALRAGADGYVNKGERLSVVVEAVRNAHARRPIIGPAQLGQIVSDLRASPRTAPLREHLTSRELTVLKALTLGKATRAIAADLGITEGTVRRHVEAIRRKFGVASKLEAVSAALQHRIVELPRP